jgi:flagellar FliJ protein
MAKRHTFRLETLLRLRRQKEDEQKRVVASRLRRIRTLEENKHVLESRIAEQTETMRAMLVEECMEVDQLKSGRYWVIRLRRAVLETDAAIAAERALLAQERLGLTERRKDTKVLQRLKEKQYEAFMAEERRQEQFETDDLNAARFARAAVLAGTKNT